MLVRASTLVHACTQRIRAGRRRARWALSASALAFAGALLASGAEAQDASAEGDWRTINGDLAATRYSPLTDINRDNVSDLAVAWTYPIRGFTTAVPLVIDGVMYLPAGGGRIVALDADTGEEIWSYEVPRPAGGGQGPGGGPSNRGVSYWPGDGESPPRILAMAGSRLLALDAATGTPVEGFGEGGVVDVGVSYGGTPTIYRNVAVIGAATLENPVGPPGNPRAFDVRTGEKLWEFQTVPRPGEPYNETWGEGWKDRSGANMWAFAAPVDVERGLVYLPISGPAANYWGGDRPGANVFANSIVAVDIETGEYRWHFQTVHHDLWDTDMPSAGALIDVRRDGEEVPVIAHVGKSSFVYVLDRATGEPYIEVEERPVPAGDVPGEYYHPTQPIPVRPPPLSRVSMTRDDVVTAEDTTPEHAAACEALWEKSGGFVNDGPFQPFLFHEEGAPPRSTVQLPGGIGGVNWGGVAADPTTGWIYAQAHDGTLVGWVEEKDPDVEYSFDAGGSRQPYDRASISGKGPFFSFTAPISGQYDENGRAVGPSAPCIKPPWARLVAVDANTGEIKWSSVLGLHLGLPEGKQHVGDAGSAGPTVTAGGLVFIGATNDRRFRAFDSATGEQLWEVEIPANANANPMSYRGKSGKQYVAIAAGGQLTAFALP